jgi:hypothetical protein
MWVYIILHAIVIRPWISIPFFVLLSVLQSLEGNIEANFGMTNYNIELLINRTEEMEFAYWTGTDIANKVMVPTCLYWWRPSKRQGSCTRPTCSPTCGNMHESSWTTRRWWGNSGWQSRRAQILHVRRCHFRDIERLRPFRVANLIRLRHVASPCSCEAPSSVSARCDGRRRLLEPRPLGHPRQQREGRSSYVWYGYCTIIWIHCFHGYIYGITGYA